MSEAPAGMTASIFLSTPSARRATTPQTPPTPTSWYFYPRPPRGGRPLETSILNLLGIISIHALREEGDTLWQTSLQNHLLYFYPRPPRGGRHVEGVLVDSFVVISIHALREEGDRSIAILYRIPLQFLSTPSARRATSPCTVTY